MEYGGASVEDTTLEAIKSLQLRTEVEFTYEGEIQRGIYQFPLLTNQGIKLAISQSKKYHQPLPTWDYFDHEVRAFWRLLTIDVEDICSTS